MPEQESYTIEQTYTVTYTGLPEKLELQPDSNVDIRLGSGIWQYEVRALDGNDDVVELTPGGGKPQSYVSIEATNAEIAAGLEAAGLADGMAALAKLRQGMLKVAKAKLT